MEGIEIKIKTNPGKQVQKISKKWNCTNFLEEFLLEINKIKLIRTMDKIKTNRNSNKLWNIVKFFIFHFMKSW